MIMLIGKYLKIQYKTNKKHKQAFYYIYDDMKQNCIQVKIAILLTNTFVPEFDITNKKICYKDGNETNVTLDNIYWEDVIKIKKQKNKRSISDISYKGEIWKVLKTDVANSENYYMISNFGRIFSKRSCRLLKPRYDKTTGYFRVSISVDKVTKNYMLNRLVAETFIPNPNNLPVARYKTDDHSDNKVSNLYWGYSIPKKRISEKIQWLMSNPQFYLLYADYCFIKNNKYNRCIRPVQSRFNNNLKKYGITKYVFNRCINMFEKGEIIYQGGFNIE